MSWVQAARAVRGEGRQHNGHTQRSKFLTGDSGLFQDKLIKKN